MSSQEFSTVQAVQLATRNHGMPLEALRYPITPVGLHYLLIHFDIPVVGVGGWRLTIGGEVERPLSLSLDDLHGRDATELSSTMECAGNGRAGLDPMPASQPWLLEAVGNARWRGVGLRMLLDEAGLTERAVEILFTGLDRGIDGGTEESYQRSLPLSEATRDDVLLAYEMNGAPLLPQHGSPLRLVVPGWYGMTNVKWLTAITAVDRPFDGYQQEQAYRLRRDADDEGVALTRMLPRALMVPPGIPEFLTRERLAEAGEHLLEGRAWSGQAPIAQVEVSDDGGETWQPADLAHDAGERWAWRSWTYHWSATPGPYTLCCRATDEAGNVQPLEPEWNVGGYANNSVQRIPVTVSG
jgi:DMSO/TMAO reductase YedYZ molybdopterin-dependent catalytic subunit